MICTSFYSLPLYFITNVLMHKCSTKVMFLELSKSGVDIMSRFEIILKICLWNYSHEIKLSMTLTVLNVPQPFSSKFSPSLHPLLCGTDPSRCLVQLMMGFEATRCEKRTGNETGWLFLLAMPCSTCRWRYRTVCV